MATTTERMTVEQYLAVTTEGDRTQLIGGVMVLNEASLLHQAVQANIVGELRAWTRAAPGRGKVFGPIDVLVGEHDHYGPDVSWIAERHVPADLSKRLTRLPDLCVEVRSPSTWRYDVGRKKAMYERAGLSELWLVDTVARTVLVYRGPGFETALELAVGEALCSPQLPGFSLPVAAIFDV